MLRTLERPGLRWLTAATASVAETGVKFRPIIVRPLPGGAYLHRHIGGALVLPKPLSRKTPAEMERNTRDICCFGYTPEPGDTVLDIGAGCGEETVTFSRLVGPRGRVISVEAHPATYGRLLLTCRYNSLSNVIPMQHAVADTETSVTIDDGAPEYGGSIAATIGGSGKTEVRAVTIDQILAGQGCERVDLLKMNIEGAEQLAIRGMTRSMSKIRNVVISCHDFISRPELPGSDPAWFATYGFVAAFLRDSGFTLLRRRSEDPRPWVRYYVYGSRA